MDVGIRQQILPPVYAARSLKQLVKGRGLKLRHNEEHALRSAQPQQRPRHFFKPAGKHNPGVQRLLHRDAETPQLERNGGFQPQFTGCNKAHQYSSRKGSNFASAFRRRICVIL